MPRSEFRFDARPDQRNRYLRGGLHHRDMLVQQSSAAGAVPPYAARPGVSFELPPGATFEPDPQTSFGADNSVKKT